MAISQEEYSYTLRKYGAMRKKLARAAGCIVEYVGHVAYFAQGQPPGEGRSPGGSDGGARRWSRRPPRSPG